MEERSFNDISFEAFLKEEKLMGSKCKSCGKLFVPPRPICIDCSGTDMEWVEVKGDGKLSAFTCIAVGPPAMKEEGYTREHPYCTGVVELEEGPPLLHKAKHEHVSKTAFAVLVVPAVVSHVRSIHLRR